MDFRLLIEKLKTYPLAISCFFLILVIIAVIFSRRSLSDELSLKEADLASQLRAIEENNKNSEGLKADLEALKTLNETVKSRLLVRDQRAVNINFFYNLEDQYDVSYSSIQQAPDADPLYAKGGARALNLHSTVVFNLSLTGSFKEVLRFMHGLDETERLIRVVSYGLSDAGDVASLDNVSASMRIIVLAEPD